MGGHDAELILVAGALLAAGIVGALLADRVRIPGLLLFLALGMLAGSEGIGGVKLNNTEEALPVGQVAHIPDLFPGGRSAGLAETPPLPGSAASPATIFTTGTTILPPLA